MAIAPKVVIPAAKIDATDLVNYPQGKAQDVTAPGDATGTPWVAVLENDVFGFQQALLKDAGATPSGSPETANVSQYLDAVKSAALKAQVVNHIGANISVSGFLERQGIWATSESEIQAANDYLVGILKHDTIRLPPNSTIGVSSVITLDTSYVSLEGNGAVLVASGIPGSGVALKLNGTALPALAQPPAALRGFTILGPGRATGSAGLDLRNASHGSNGPTGLIMEDVNLKSFGIGKWFGSAVYPITMRDCGTFDCGTALDFNTFGAGVVEAFGGVIDDCDLAADLVYNARHLNLFGVLVKDCLKLFALVEGKLELYGCVMQADDYLVTPITLSGAGGSILMAGGELRLGDPAPSAFPYWVDAGADSSFQSRGLRLHNTLTSGGVFANGDGQVLLRETQYKDPATECSVFHSERSAVSDGGFEQPSVVDDIFITQSDAAITDRFTVGGTALATSAVVKRTGVRSLAWTKAGAGAVDSAFVLALIPVQAFERIGGEVWWKKPADSSTGSISFDFSFVTMAVNSEGVPEIRTQGPKTQAPQGISGADTGWVQRTIPPSASPFVAPEWATHFLVEVVGTGWNSGGNVIYFDDLNVNIVG